MKVDIAIMTIRQDEFTAVRRCFQTERRRIPDGRTYLIGDVKTEKQTYTIAIARCTDQGSDASQRLAHYIIQNLDPQLILVVGIAGGVPHDEFTLGDVVVSTRIVNPNVDAWQADGTTDYMTRGGPPHPLVENIVSLLPGEPHLARWTDTIQLKRPTLDPALANITGDDEWREKVRKSLNWHFGEEQHRGRPSTFTIGPILSSNHLMKDPARLRELLKTHRSILAVEMEVAGVYEAAQGIDHQYPVMAIRGISDIVGFQRDGRWTEYACQTAAAFTYAFIMTDPLDPPLNSASFQKPVAPSVTSSAQIRGSEPSLDAQHSVRHHVKQLMVEHIGMPKDNIQPPSARCDFYEHVSLPPNYVERPEVLTALRAALLSNAPATALTSAVQSPKPHVLHGMGGIGKSVVARAVCDDRVIQEAFPHGILWATLGQTPDLISKMGEWVDALSGATVEKASTIDGLKNTLAKLLKNRSCLLVLDDVWKISDGEAFHRGGPRCRLLLTTRDAEIAHAFSAKVQPVPIMGESEALTLLEEWADGQLTQADPKIKARIIKRLGYLPLAVKLAGAQLKQIPPDQWLATFNIQKLKSPRGEHLHADLERTFELSLLQLCPRAYHFYISLAIFEEDETIPHIAIERLWQALADLDTHAVTELLNDLATRALLEISSYQPPLTVQLHDLLRDFIHIKLGNDRIKGTHQTLLNAYRALPKEASWDTVEDDGYIYDHLVYHLRAIGAMHELKALFADPKWLHVRVRQSDYSYRGYLKDLMYAWKSAEAETLQQTEAQEEPTAFADCLRYLLINATIQSLGYLYNPDLIASAVKAGFCSPQRALTIARRFSSVQTQMQLCIKLLEITSLSKKQREEVERFGLQIILENKHVREEAIATLAPWFSEEMLEEDLSTILTLVEEGGEELEELASAVPILMKQLRERGLGTALETAPQREPVQDMDSQVSQVSEGDVEQELALRVAVSDRSQRAFVLLELEPHLSGVTREIVQEIVLNDLSPFDMGLPYQIRLAYTQLSAEQRSQISNQGLEATLNQQNGRDRTMALAVFLPLVTDQHELLKIIRRSITTEIWTLQRWSRRDLFLEYFSKELFVPPIFSSEMLNAIAWDIIEIGEQWGWL